MVLHVSGKSDRDNHICKDACLRISSPLLLQASDDEDFGAVETQVFFLFLSSVVFNLIFTDCQPYAQRSQTQDNYGN